MHRDQPPYPSPCDLAQGGHSGSSWLAGGQVGFNYQVGQWVWGIEAEFSATRIREAIWISCSLTEEFLHSRTNFIGTVAPRLGLAWDRALIYAKGGVAWVNDDYWLSITQSVLVDQTFVTGGRNAVGWMVGVGDRVRIRAKLVRQSRVRLYGFWNRARFTHQQRRNTGTAYISMRTSGEGFKL